MAHHNSLAKINSSLHSGIPHVVLKGWSGGEDQTHYTLQPVKKIVVKMPKMSTSSSSSSNSPTTRRCSAVINKRNPQYGRQKESQPPAPTQDKKSTLSQEVDILVIGSLCLLCNSSINLQHAKRFLQDIQYHYTLCFFKQGLLQEIVPPINNDERKRQYLCSHQGCTKREMRYKEYCVHEGISHRKTQQLMARTPGFENVLSCLYPPNDDDENEY